MRDDGGGELASRRNKKARDFTQPFFHKSTLLRIGPYLCSTKIIIFADDKMSYRIVLLLGRKYTGWPISSRTWVGLTSIWDVPQAIGLYCSAAQARQWNIPNGSQPPTQVREEMGHP